MTVEIAVYDVTPFLQGAVPFGGSFLEDLLLHGDLTSATPEELVFQDPGSGAMGTIRGSFVLENGVPEGGRIREISLIYQNNVFQDWTGVNWSVTAVSSALDAVNRGDADAFDRFLHADDYLFRAVGNPFGLPYSVYATRGNDIIEADGQSAGLDGLDGDDTIFGGAGVDAAYGGDGFDRIFGGLDGDVLRGGARSDLLFGGEGQDDIRGGTGFDRLFGGDEARFGDYIYGEGGDDRIEGDGGDDNLYGGDGNDTLRGGDGRDTLEGNDGDDRLFGGTGIDWLEGGDGADLLFGGDGRDRIEGLAGDDRIYGGEGGGELYGGDGSDLIVGGAERELITAGAGDDTVYGGGGNDRISDGFRTGGFDVFFGGDGNDEIIAAGMRDTIYGGEGRDDLRDLPDGRHNIFGDGGDDTIESRWKAWGGDGNDSMTAFNTEGTVILKGGLGDDSMTGYAQMYGDGGADRLFLQAGDEVGRAWGGAGDDHIEYSGDVATEPDTTRFDILGGSGDDIVTGGAYFRARVHGQQGDDDLTGRVLFGGTGNDILREALVFDFTERDNGRPADSGYDFGDDQIFGWRGSARFTDYDVAQQRPIDPEYTTISRIDLPDPDAADVVYSPLIRGVTVIHDGGTIAIHDLYFGGGAEDAFLWTAQVRLALI